MSSYDQEKGQLEETPKVHWSGADDGPGAYQGDALPEEAIAAKFRLGQTFFKKLFALGVEARGIERVPEDERSDRNSLNSLFLWFSVNTVLTTRTPYHTPDFTILSSHFRSSNRFTRPGDFHVDIAPCDRRHHVFVGPNCII